jgi:S-adenosylmethionine:tRNA ribosyltransferase-isomerase
LALYPEKGTPEVRLQKQPDHAVTVLDAIHRLGVHFATITHAAGISSTGDAKLDTRLPFDEPYRITESAARSIRLARAVGGRLIAIGTTVVRALEHAVSIHGSLRETAGVATNKVGPATELLVVDAILSGTHEPGTSHHQLLSAFVDQQMLAKMDQILRQHAYRTHEFGDSVFVEKSKNREFTLSCLHRGLHRDKKVAGEKIGE